MVRYHFREGVTLDKKKSRWFGMFTSLVFIAAALYGLALYLSPQLVTIPFANLSADATYQKMKDSMAGQHGDRLYLPQINVDVAINQGGDSSQLIDGARQRNTELGDPVKGGNFVLSAVKFTLDITPWLTRSKSPFYNIGKLKPGDQITIDYRQTRYTYEVDKTYPVSEGSGIEKKSSSARLTLYPTDSKGDAAAGTVVGAKLVSPAKETKSLQEQ